MRGLPSQSVSDRSFVTLYVTFKLSDSVRGSAPPALPSERNHSLGLPAFARSGGHCSPAPITPVGKPILVGT